MEKSALIARFAQNDDDKMLLAQVLDKLSAAQQKNIPGATRFLTPRERALAEGILKAAGISDAGFFGGCETAERRLAYWLPEYLEPEDWLLGSDGPICCVRARFPAEQTLTHRDFLGSLMGCGIRRETVGDLYLSPGSCDCLLTREVLPFLLQNFLTAGRTTLKLEELPLAELAVPETKVERLRDTVAGLRLDSVAAVGFRISRGKAAEAIEGGRASLNDLPCEKPDRAVREGDRISVRGLGKIVLREVGGLSKKGRISIIVEKYC